METQALVFGSGWVVYLAICLCLVRKWHRDKERYAAYQGKLRMAMLQHTQLKNYPDREKGGKRDEFC